MVRTWDHAEERHVWGEEMAFVSVTRLRVRTAWFLPGFFWYALGSMRQAERSEGFLGGRVLSNAQKVFWTVTVWKDERAMNAYRTKGAHLKAMPKLLHWCDEAAVAHWSQESAEIPAWDEAHRRMVEEGRASKVQYPSAAHKAKEIAAPVAKGSARTLKPRRQA